MVILNPQDTEKLKYCLNLSVLAKTVMLLGKGCFALVVKNWVVCMSLYTYSKKRFGDTCLSLFSLKAYNISAVIYIWSKVSSLFYKNSHSSSKKFIIPHCTGILVLFLKNSLCYFCVFGWKLVKWLYRYSVHSVCNCHSCILSLFSFHCHLFILVICKKVEVFGICHCSFYSVGLNLFIHN